MAFDVGTRLGPYEILGSLGEGGMGAVYRARDTRLDRIVAIKVLAGALAADPEARRRFEDEARAIAALNDPHICTLHDIGRAGELDYLVLEYLEGETLARRLERGGALPPAEAIAIAAEIGDALARAHRAGIAHRDLKPGNVMLIRRPGADRAEVKLLDFGLASRRSGPGARPLEASLAATMAASMMATHPATGPAAAGANSGAIAGTLPYMAPEQLDGHPGDHRSDVFAFGCVLYEMLAGRRAFAGSTALTVMAAIMGAEPAPIPALASAHPLVGHLLRRCLDKDPDRRWQNVGDLAGELRWAADHTETALAAGPWRPSRAAIAGALAALVLLVPLAITGARALLAGSSAAATDGRAFHLEITTPPTDDVSGALAPDGRTLAFVALRDHVPVLWVRALAAAGSRPLPGTEGASFPFWSPDGATLGFFADNKLKRIDVSGGTPIVLASAPNARGGAWGPDGTILFAPGVNAPIRKVAARGGAVQDVTALNAGAGPGHRRPGFLPDGKHFVFTSSLGAPDTNGVYVGSLDGSPPVRILPDEDNGGFAPPDRLLTLHQNNLQAYRFDVATRKVSGDPVVVAQGLNSAGVFGASLDGTLAYRAGGAQVRRLVWVNRQGTVLQDISGPRGGSIASPELSPDEKSVALFLHPGAGEDNDVWIFELARFLGRPVTVGPPADAHPLWDPDGSHVIFNSARSGDRGPTRFPVTGGRPEILVGRALSGSTVLSMTRDRRFLLTRGDARVQTGIDLLATSLPDGRTFPVTESTGDETEGQFSPDGSWVAYVGSVSGRAEVYVQPFPQGGSPTQVSTAGGSQVRWSADGREIYFVAPDGKLMAVGFMPASGTVTLPVALFQTHLANGNNVIGNKAQYAVSRDGRFLLNTVVESPSIPIVVSVNWARALRRN